jgi:hypothetical protein
LINIFKNKNEKYDLKKYYDLNRMFNNECQYSNYICSKIKLYYNIDNMNDIIKNKNQNKECIDYFPQYTNVLSYYFLKNILINNHIKFGKIYLKYNTNYKINNDLFNEEIIKLIINDMKNLDKRLVKINKNDKNNSLKMSYYEIMI